MKNIDVENFLSLLRMNYGKQNETMASKKLTKYIFIVCK